MSAPGGTATIALQIVLNDVASSGLNALGLGFLGLSTNATNLSRLFGSSLSPAILGLGATAVASGVIFAAFAGALGYVIDQGMQLQTALNQVSISVKGASDNMSGMQQVMITLGNTSVYSTQQIADGFTAMGKNGQNAADIINYSGQQMVILAEAIKSDTVPAANLLSSTMQMFGANASEAADYTKALTFAFYNGQGTVELLQQAISQAGAQAHLMGIPFNDLAIAVAFLGEAGLKGSQAGSALRYMLASLSDPTVKAQAELAALGLVIVNSTNPAFIQLRNQLLAAGGAAGTSATHFDGTVGSLQKMFTEAKAVGILHTDQAFYAWATAAGILNDKLYNSKGQFVGMKQSLDDLAQSISKLNPHEQAIALQQMFNVRGSRAVQQFVDNLAQLNPEWAALKAQLQNTSPIDDAAKQTGTLAGEMKALGTSIQDAAGVIGQQLQQPLATVVGWFNQLVGQFAKAPAPLHEAVAAFLVIGTVLSGLALAASVVGIAFAIAGTPLLIIGASMIALMIPIGILTAAFLLLKDHLGWLPPLLGDVAGWFHQLVSATGPLGPLMQALGVLFSSLGATLRSTLGPTLKQLGDIVQQQLVPAWKGLESALAPLTPYLGLLKIVLIGVAALIIGPVVIGIFVFVQVLRIIIPVLAEVLTGVVSFAAGLIRFLVGGFQVSAAFIGGILAVLGDVIHWNWGKIGADATNAWHGIWAGIQNMVGGLWAMVQGYFHAGVLSVLTIWGTLASNILSNFRQLPGALTNIGHNIINSLVSAILSGTGAVGGAMRALAQSMLSSLMGQLGIHSPSTVMLELGRHTTTGFVLGLTGVDVAGPTRAHFGTVATAARSSLVNGLNSSRTSSSSGASAGGGDLHVHVEVASKEVASVVLDSITKTLKLNGAARKGR